MNVIITLKLPITYITSVLFCILFNSVKGQEDFDIFLNKFKADCFFQNSRIVDTCILVQPNIENINHFDTIMFLKDEWLCDSTIITYSSKKMESLDKTKIVLFYIPDTGILLHYYFILIKNNWYLYKIEDYSM